MTILPVPLTDFRGDMAKYLNMLGAVEIHVTKHGRTIAVVRKPEDARKVEDPPGEERVRLMEALLSGEGESTTITPVTSTPGDPRYHTGVSGAAGSALGRGGAGGSLMTPSGPAGVTVGPKPTPRFVFPSDLNDGLFRPSPTEVHRVVDGVDVGPAETLGDRIARGATGGFVTEAAWVTTDADGNILDCGTVADGLPPRHDDAGQVTVVDDNDPFGLLDFLGEPG